MIRRDSLKFYQKKPTEFMKPALNIYHILSDKQWSGPEQYAYDLIAQIKDDGNKYYTEVVTQNRPKIIEHFRSLEVPVSILPLKSLSDLDSSLRLARQIKRGNNILHVHTMKDAATAVLACHISENPNNRVVLTSHSVEKPKTSFWYRRILRDIDHIIFSSRISYNEFIDHAKRFDRSRASVINDSIRPMLNYAETYDLRRTCEIDADKALILFHGRVCKEKGVDVLLRALTQLDKSTYHLAIIGDGDKRFVKRLRSFIEANQLEHNITMLGYQPNLQELLVQADFGVLPAAWREPFGISNLEYMMLGKAHIATNNGGQVEYLQNEKNALLVNPSDFSELAAAIKRLIDDPALRHSIGAQAQADFNSRLSYKHFYSQIIDLYTGLYTK